MLVSHVELFRRYWYPLGFVDRLSGRPRHRRLLGTDLVVWLTADGEPVVALDRCPHRDAPLSCGWQTDTTLACSYHGWEFGLDGRAVSIPALEQDVPIPPAARLTLLPSTVRYGVVWASLEPDPVGGIPEVAEHGADGWRVIHEFDDPWDCSAPHLLDNNMDGAHVAFVHRDTFGSSNPRVPGQQVARTPDGFRLDAVVPVSAQPGEVGETVRLLTVDVVGPFLGVFRIEYPDGLVHIMVKGCVPVDDEASRLVQWVVRNDVDDPLPVEDIVAFDAKVQAEDAALLARMPAAYATDQRANVHLRCDRASLELRRLYADMAAGALPPYATAGA